MSSPPEPFPGDSAASQPIPKQSSLPEDPPWSLLDVLFLVVLGAFALFTCGIIAVTVAARLPAFQGMETTELAGDARVLVPAQLAAYIVLIVFMRLVVAGRTAAGFWDAVRWRWPSSSTALLYVFIGIALSIGVQVGSRLLPIPESLPIERMFRDPVSSYMLAAFGILVAPLVEELFFRGFFYPVLARRLGAGAGVAITAAVFAVIHSAQLDAAWPPLLLLFMVGLAITAVRAWIGSVAASFLIHAAYNGAIFFLLYLATAGFTDFERLQR